MICANVFDGLRLYIFLSLHLWNKQFISKNSKQLTGRYIFRVEAEPGKDYLRIAWIGLITEERAKEGLMKEKEAMEATHRTMFLIDNRKQKGPFPTGIDKWILEIWMPEAEKLGFSKSAQILSENAFTELSSKQLQKAIGSIIANFGSEEEAVKWLTE